MTAGKVENWVVRQATMSDVSAIMDHERSIFLHDAWSEETMRAEVLNEHCYYLVVSPTDDPTRVDAYAGILTPRGSDDADIQTIAVAVRARRRGVARTLMTQLIAEASRRGASSVFLEVRADNPSAQNLYLSMGFEQIAVRPRYYQPEGVDAHVMRLILSNEKNGAE